MAKIPRDQKSLPLIIGGGPTGLAAALFLNHRGIAVRIVDAAPTPPTTSRALAVNPRTLSILAGTGVDEAILAEGRPIAVLRIHQDGCEQARIDIDIRGLGVDHPLIALPQARTEALLAAALEMRGVTLERGVGLSALSQDADGVTATLSNGETVAAPILLGADGAHSVTRHQLGLDFPGSAFPETWLIVDVEIDGPPTAEGYIDFTKDGPLIVLPLYGTVFRLIGFGPPLLPRLLPKWKVSSVLWESDFHISHRLASALNVGRVCLAGDAAHIHSPIGARGMNLGIEDAYVFAACAQRFLQGEAGALAAYGASRHKIDGDVVKRIERLTSAVRARGPIAPFVRAAVMPLVAHIKPLQHVFARMGMGLDHPLIIP
jgi:2-polyprenyl-6-methoxyphenol hydroxylase-like FAD-dependent oxidoreductase